QQLRTLPLNGYIPGSCIRGLVRAWAKQRPEIKPRMYQLLGHQDNDKITAGKIEFLDAWPETATKLTLDIVNPQQEFQVYHQGQCTPLSLYTLGTGKDAIPVIVAIRGIPEKATEEEVSEVWEWVQQALSLYGVGSRTASGY
ncbi:MAG: RAMP superfamily CRISPR-associated protein, partial [Dolichospermum sp.]